MKGITVHCLVKNETRFVWYSVMSVYKHVDKILLWDTGSSDGTGLVIKEILKGDYDKKISFSEVGKVSAQEFYKVRQGMLDDTKTGWFMLVDGDEIWWEDSIKKIVGTVKAVGSKNESIVVPTINLIGDMYHYQERAAGGYNLAGKSGHLNLRAVNRSIPGLRSEGVHGVWGWVAEDGKMIQDRDPKKIVFCDAPYLHTTHLPRASIKSAELEVPKRSNKLKYELGIPLPLDYYYPEVFFRMRPNLVPNVWESMKLSYKVKATFQTPLKKIKRRIFPKSVGY